MLERAASCPRHTPVLDLLGYPRAISFNPVILSFNPVILSAAKDLSNSCPSFEPSYLDPSRTLGMTRSDARDDEIRRSGWRGQTLGATGQTLGATCQTLVMTGRANLGVTRPYHHGMNLRSDLVAALRQIRRRPITSAAVVLLLALGIAGNVSMFASFDAWVLRPLALREPERLFSWRELRRERPADLFSMSAPAYDDLRRAQRSFAETGVLVRHRYLTGADAEATVEEGAMVSANLFALLGKAPTIGRAFTAQDDLPGQPARVVLLGERLFRERFGGDPKAIGGELRLDGEPHQIVGVMPAWFRHPEYAELWTPLGLDPAAASWTARTLTVVGRLAPGVLPSAARAEMTALAADLERRQPASHEGFTVTVEPLRRFWAPRVIDTALGATMLSRLAVLLVIAANVASLQIARDEGRRTELALRAALGASRSRLLRQMLVEAALLATAAAALGIALGALSLRNLLDRVPSEPPYLFRMVVDGRAIAYGLLVTLLAVATAVVLPSLRATGATLLSGLRAAGRGAVSSRGGARLRGVLIAAQVAVSTVLLVAGALLAKSALEAARLDLGFDKQGLLATTLDLRRATAVADASPTDAPARAALVDRLLARLGEESAIAGAAITSSLPVGFDLWRGFLETDDREVSRTGGVPVTIHASSAGYERVLGVDLLAGRPLERAEVDAGAPVAVLSQSLAADLWPSPPSDQNALGRRVRLRRDGSPWLTVVGVVSSTDPGRDMVPDNPPTRQVYIPYPLLPSTDVSLLVRAGSAPPAEAAAAVRRAAASAGYALPLDELLTLGEIERRAHWVSRFFGEQLTISAVLAVVIAGLGLYGLVAEAAVRRRREMAIRQALGAEPNSTVRLMMRHGLGLALAGAFAGMVLALLVMPLARGILMGTRIADPVLLSGIALLMIGVAAAASYLPARALRHQDPVELLRSE